VRAGGSLTVRFLVDGKPVANALLSAVSNGRSTNGRTDAAGRVTFPIDRDGAWLIKTIHMIGLQPAAPADPEWESFWVTLSLHASNAVVQSR
jgi:uncharacterized GH25 family protein